MKNLLILLAAGLLSASPARGSVPEQGETRYRAAPKVPIAAYAFSLKDVRLLDGPFKRAMDLDAQYLLDLEPDRLLSRFREYAGLEPKAEIYGGWESRGVSGHILGHYLSACAMMYAASGDERFLDRVNYIVEELALCQKAHGNGYVGAIPEAKRIFAEVASGEIKTSGFGLNGGWVPWYTLHKLHAGLLDAYRYCDSDRAKMIVTRLADWAGNVTGELSDEKFQTMLRCEHGGMNDVLADVYAVTGERKYLDLAARFNHRAVIDPLSRREDRLEGLHANTQVPKLIGAARQYELTGNEDLRAAAAFFWEAVTQHRSYVNGGNSEAEHFRRKGELWKHLTPRTAETCNTYNMLKLTRHLFAWTADGRCADYYERALYNHILASQDPKAGMMIYFCSLEPGHFHTYSEPYDSFWCCTGSGLENHVKYGEGIYFHDDASLYVNLFVASELTWKAKGLTVRQETRFPEEAATRLSLSCEEPVPLALKIRHPSWATGALKVTLNGQTFDAGSKPGGYLTIDRSWTDGDVVNVTLPMGLRVEPMENNPKKVAILYGPIVLAGQLGREGFTDGMPYSGNQKAYEHLPTPEVPVLVTDGKPVGEWLERVSGETLQFKTVGVGRPNDVSLIPFYRAHHQRFTVYWDLLSEKDWQQRQTERAAEQRRLEQLQARTIDRVVPEAEPERAHNYQGEKSSAGTFQGRRWRHAYPGGWFSYDMKVAADRPVDLMVTYWGSDVGNRTFDVMIDGRKIATQTLNMNEPGEFFDVTYPIPAELTKDKDKVTVQFQSHPGNMAGGVFGCRVVNRSGEPSGAEALRGTLDPFYKQHVVAGGLLIAGSEKVSPHALREAAHLVGKMLATRPDVLAKLVEREMYVCVMAHDEMQTDLPECRKMSLWWAKRARGLGGRPVSCGEENLLCCPGDPYRGESIFIHEFAHAVHGAVAALDEQFNERLRTLHRETQETGRFRGYGTGSFGEFWAEGVQSWFNCNHGRACRLSHAGRPRRERGGPTAAGRVVRDSGHPMTAKPTMGVRARSVAKRRAAAALPALLQLRLQFRDDLRMLEIEVVRFAGVGVEVVQLAGCFRCLLGQREGSEGLPPVVIAARAAVVEVLPRSAANGQRERDRLMKRIAAHGPGSPLPEQHRKEAVAVLGRFVG